jgi:putative hydrolase of the HAD superfamily
LKDRFRHIFFDLDHTLWDFERNSEETIAELFDELALADRISSARAVYESFRTVNRSLWDAYHLDHISKEELRKRRFEMVLEQHGLKDDDLANRFSDMYLAICPTKSYLLPNVKEVLNYLSGHYYIHLISNGFEETTSQKLISSDLTAYFITVCTPSHSGYKKPNAQMFHYALQNANAEANTSLMVGDDLEADVLGAKRFGMAQVYYNPEKKAHEHQVTFEIERLEELKDIL